MDNQLALALAISLVLVLKLMYDRIFGKGSINHEQETTETNKKIILFINDMREWLEKNTGLHTSAELHEKLLRKLLENTEESDKKLAILNLIINHLDNLHQDPNTTFATVKLEEKVDELKQLVNKVRLDIQRLK